METKYLCQMNIVIVDYKMGNIHSVARKLKMLGVNYEISNNPDTIKQADKLILPGVGHFGKAMLQLEESNLISVLNDVVLIQKKPILGICLGMQLMANFSPISHRDLGLERDHKIGHLVEQKEMGCRNI